MRAVLTAEEMTAHDERWQGIKDYKADMADPPAALKAYEKMLTEAGFKEMKADAAKKRSTAERSRDKADDAYETAEEHLQEILTDHPEYRMWLDRNETEDLTGEGAVRLVSSRSIKKKPCGIEITIRDIKLQTLEAKLDELTITDVQKDAAQKLPETAKDRLHRLTS